jgi:GTP cyclohydrolase I/GTP cyclohydrolase-4
VATQEVYTLLGSAMVSEEGTRRVLGVSAQGMTACPCAQNLVEGEARERLSSDGFSDEEIERIIAAVPIATHNQRGTGTLQIGIPESSEFRVEVTELLRIVENSMSSEIYELMKRTDERAVVEKAHSRPRFVEDCVREMVIGFLETVPEESNDDLFMAARQENAETIHQHTVFAERSGLVEELRRELKSNTPSENHLSLREWLDRRD